jgi:ribonuclease BN (tRNA processing enzyme)
VLDHPLLSRDAASETRDGRSGLSVIVVGCDGSWTGPGGAGSGYVVASGTTCLLLDAGPGTFANLQQCIEPATIDAVIISHHHPDHWTDLYALTTHARFALGRQGIPVYAPAGLAERARLEDSPVIEWHEVTDGDTVQIGALACVFCRTDHSFETLAVRIDGGGRALGYSADTGPGWSLAELGTDLDLVLSEATYTVEHEGTAGHLSGRQAGEQARKAGARRLVVTHRWPTIDPSTLADEAQVAFGSAVEQAAIGKEFVL